MLIEKAWLKFAHSSDKRENTAGLLTYGGGALSLPCVLVLFLLTSISRYFATFVKWVCYLNHAKAITI